MKKLKRSVIEINGENCEICALPPIWNGSKLTMQLDHIDGNRHNNNLCNLRIICPNCHTQTSTFGNKGSTKRYKDYHECSEEIIIEYLKTGGNTIYGLCETNRYNSRNPNCRKFIYEIIFKSTNDLIIQFLDVLVLRNSFGTHNIKKSKIHNSVSDYMLSIKLKTDEKYKDTKIQILNSDIDFSKFGWVNKVALVIGISPQKVNKWMQRHLPEFYESNCFVRRRRSNP